ncbi:CPBP family intramembrane glutamic endopeptidase [Hyphobacterium sp.]|uniref:CPBP family intramembrane glutamic endopeptidase n=1 Tax=Hyphobacterium sp. TaxID=2004662 RepID=UPI00374A8FD2
MIQLLARRPVTIFMILTMIVTYPLGIAALIGLQPLQDIMPDGIRDDLITGTVSRYAPTLVALFMMATVYGTPAFRAWLAQLFRVAVHPAYYLGILLIMIAGWAIAAGLVASGSGADVSALIETDLASSDFTLISRLIDYGREIAYVFVTNGEETGWRFFLTAILLTRMRLFPASLVIWALWSFWHWPILLLSGGGLNVIAAFTVLLMPATLLASWLYAKTDSLFLLLFAHGVFNATTEYAYARQFPGLEAVTSQYEALAALYMAAVFGFIALIVVARDRALFFQTANPIDDGGWASRAERHGAELEE